MRKLREVRAPLANFFASGLLNLGEKLGPVLWQLPPNLGFDSERLEAFFDLLPRDMAEAARLAHAHEPRMNGRAAVDPLADAPIRHALEVRHDSFKTPAFIDLLRRRDVACVVADTVAWPCIPDATADFVYVRLHGSEELYVSGYDPPALGRWAERVRTWAEGGTPTDMAAIAEPAGGTSRRDVYVYFDNDAKVRAPADAKALAHLLGVGPSVSNGEHGRH